MDPVATVNAAVLALDAILNIIGQIKGQSGMTDDQIIAAAQSQTLANSAQIAQILASLPPSTPPSAVSA